MLTIQIFGKGLSEAEIHTLMGLLEAAACPKGQIEVISSIDEPDPDADDEVVLMLGTASTCTDPALEEELTKAANGSRRAIWVWPPDSKAADLPEAANTYCYSVVAWDAEKLRVVLSEDDKPCFQTPAGAPLPKVTTDRNLCVKEEEETKSK